jgi:3-hydroxybutyryl-CoA dehydrogenase
MGTGIAHAFAQAVFPVVLVDKDADALKRAMGAIQKIVDDGVRLGKVEAAAAAQVLQRLTPVQDLQEGSKGATLLVETVVESLDVKKQVMGMADPLLRDDAVIATNTSALSVTEVATAVRDPSRVIGMHFFNPVHKMKLVEIVLGLETGGAALTRVRDYCAKIGKTSIVVNEAPGLTTSRMSALAGNEAMYMLMEGTASAEDIDTAMRMGFNHPMGPLELGDLTGWDTRLSVIRYLHQTLGEKFRPCPLITKMVAAGRLGRKAGAGVYLYRDGQKVPGSGLKASML